MFRNILKKNFYIFILILIYINTSSVFSADYYSYDGQVASNVKRDRIIAIAEDHFTLYYYLSSDNATAQCSGVTVFDTTVGWKNGTKYCWGGETTTKQFLSGLQVPLSAGNRNTSGDSSYGSCAVGEDCSGFVSNAWTSPRQATSGFGAISDDITWDQLRIGDALNEAGSHIRLFDYYISNVGTAMLYEQTSGSGLYWKMLHRSLARDNNYQPIRYNYTYDVIVYPQPDILYIKRTGTERVEVRWDGQADTGFRLYVSGDGTNWTLLRDYNKLTYDMRTCEVSGLTPDKIYYFKMTSYNTGGETADSDVVAYRLDGASSHRLLLVDGFDRYPDLNSNQMHTLLIRFGVALGARGIGFDFCSNEAIVDEQINLNNYTAVVWMLGTESTFDETFSWAEQMHVMDFLTKGGHLFVSGAEIGWDLDYRANYTYYKNGHINDRPFYNEFLRASYSTDDANTYRVVGASGTIFAGMDFYFDDGTHGTYNVTTPDVLNTYNSSTAGLTYSGGTGGNACVYDSSLTSGTVVNFGFPFETIYPEDIRKSVMKAILNYFDLSVIAPTIKSAKQTASDTINLTWDGYASLGFRLFQKIGSGSWTQIKDESVLGTDSRSTTVSGLSPATRYAFKIRAVNSTEESADSDVVICSLNSSGNKILVVDGYDRWNSQHSYNNHTLLENFADALSSNSQRYDSCTNESITAGDINLADYDIVMWMCGEESTESETFSYDEQVTVQNYLKTGGKLFVSGAEVGYDLVAKGNTANNYSNGNENDTPFFNDYLKTVYVNDDAATYQIRGISGTVFNGRNFYFDDGTHGTYNVAYPDTISTYGGSVNALYYGSSGTNVAGITYTGTVLGGSSPAKLIFFGFPFETIYLSTSRADIMSDILEYFAEPIPTPTPTPIFTETPTLTPTPTPFNTPTPSPTSTPTNTPTATPTPNPTPGVGDWNLLM